MSEKLVLVTGSTGFIGGHVVRELLAQGYRVRGTVRSPRSPGDDGVEFVETDLTRDEGWARAMDGVDHVIHVASPVMPGHVENEDEVIVPAREGALRVLRAARSAGVGRVVLTSAFHAVAWGHPHDDHVFTEDDWTVLDGPGTDAYGRAKTLAERAAWEFAAAEGLELTTLLPVAVVGAVSGRELSGLNGLIGRLLDGRMPGLLNTYFPMVDVRDVAFAHVRALTAPDAAGQRFLLGSDPAMRMRDIAALLTSQLGEAAAKVPGQVIPDDAVRAGAATNPALRAAVNDLGYARRFSTGKARRVLGWDPRPASEAVLAAARSILTAS